MSSLAALALALSLAAANAKPATPHIVFMLADDLGYGIPGWGGNPTQITPALDALRADGLTLTENHVYQFCSPSKPGLHPGFSRLCSRRAAKRCRHCSSRSPTNRSLSLEAASGDAIAWLAQPLSLLPWKLQLQNAVAIAVHLQLPTGDVP